MNESPDELNRKVHEKTDFEQYIFQYELLAADVQASGDLALYEMMRNTVLNKLIPYMDDAQLKEYEQIRGWKRSPLVARIEAKEKLTSKILDSIGTQFTPRRKATIKKGVALLWELYPPYPSEDSTQ